MRRIPPRSARRYRERDVITDMRPGTRRARVNVKIAIFSIKRQTRSMNETPRPGRPLADMRPGPRVTHRLWLFEEDLSPLNISRGATKSQRTRVPTPATMQRAATLRPVEGALVTALASGASVGSSPPAPLWESD